MAVQISSSETSGLLVRTDSIDRADSFEQASGATLAKASRDGLRWKRRQVYRCPLLRSSGRISGPDAFKSRL